MVHSYKNTNLYIQPKRKYWQEDKFLAGVSRIKLLWIINYIYYKILTSLEEFHS